MLKNFASKLIAAALLVSPLASFAQPSTGSFSYYHQPGFSMQLASGIDYAYYTKDHTYTYGVYGLTYIYQVGGTDVDGFNELNPGFFFRKNYKIDKQTQWFIGTSWNSYYLQNTKGVDYKSDAFGTKPIYTGFEYFASPKVGVSASIRPFVYQDWGTDAASKQTYTYVTSGAVQFNYIF